MRKRFAAGMLALLLVFAPCFRVRALNGSGVPDAGEPVYETEENDMSADSSDVLWTFGLALLVAWAITSSMKRRMTPVQKAGAARNYTVRGSYELRRYNEFFLGTTVTRQPRNQNRGGGPGDGGRRF